MGAGLSVCASREGAEAAEARNPNARTNGFTSVGSSNASEKQSGLVKLLKSEGEGRAEEDPEFLAVLAHLKRQGVSKNTLNAVRHQVGQKGPLRVLDIAVQGFFESLESKGLTLEDVFPRDGKLSIVELEKKLRDDFCDDGDVDAITRSISAEEGELKTNGEMWDELIKIHFAASLQLQDPPMTLRQFYVDLDRRKYGYLTHDVFVNSALECKAPLNRQELSALFKIFARDKDSIEYQHVFDEMKLLLRSSTGFNRTLTHSLSCLQHLGEESKKPSLRCVVVITRHGARFPLKPFPKSSVWPKGAEFWKSYGGKLSPVGITQHRRLGEQLAAKYLTKERLVNPQDPNCVEKLGVYTSNCDRALMSAMGLLNGMFPFLPFRFLWGEDTTAMTPAVRKASTFSIPITVCAERYSPLLHGFKENAKYEELKHAAFSTGQFAEWSKEPEYIELLDKLWNITGYKKLDPVVETDAAERLQHLQSCAQQISIEKAHNNPMLQNKTNEKLEKDDKRLMSSVAKHICRLRYCGSSPHEQAELSRRAAGMLPGRIVEMFEQAMDEDSFPGAPMEAFKLFSAHDNTIMALLAFLGIDDFAIPNFAAFVSFELRKEGEQWNVKVVYCPNPDSYRVPGFVYAKDANTKHDAKYFMIPEDPLYGVKTEDLEDGSKGMPFEDFKKNIMEKRGAYPTREAWTEDGKLEVEEHDDKNKKKWRKVATVIKAASTFSRSSGFFADVSVEEEDEVDMATYLGPSPDDEASPQGAQSLPNSVSIDSIRSVPGFSTGSSPVMPARAAPSCIEVIPEEAAP